MAGDGRKMSAVPARSKAALTEARRRKKITDETSKESDSVPFMPRQQNLFAKDSGSAFSGYAGFDGNEHPSQQEVFQHSGSFKLAPLRKRTLRGPNVEEQ